MNQLRFGHTALYRLKRDYGVSIDLYRSTGQSVDLETGKIVTTKTKLCIRRAVLLPSTLIGDYVHEIFYKRERNDKYQGIFDLSQRQLVIDRRDLKGIFTTITTSDWIVFDNTRWEISKIDTLEQNIAYHLLAKRVSGSTKYEIHTRNLKSKLVFTEELS